ncbi:FGFR1 oncogene partner 2 isoform 2-T2 [Thomomys bottae]
MAPRASRQRPKYQPKRWLIGPPPARNRARPPSWRPTPQRPASSTRARDTWRELKRPRPYLSKKSVASGSLGLLGTCLKMSCTIEKALADAKALVERLRDHDDAAESLIEQTTALNKRVEAMKQYQEEIQELNEVARHRPRSTLVMGIQQENRQIRELQQENKELRTSLEEHQSALELIMSKYREQMFRLLMASKRDDPGIIMKLKEQHSKELQAHVDQITEMAAVMRKAIEIDEKQGCKEQERIFQLEQENKGLREILQITRESFLNLRKEDVSDSTSLSALVTSSDLSLRKS